MPCRHMGGSGNVAPLLLTLARHGVGGQLHVSANLPPVKEYSMNRRLVEPYS